MIGQSEWEATAQTKTRTISVPSFELDRFEVTEHRYKECVGVGRCTKPDRLWREPGLPITGVTPEQAASFCKFVGGRLPNDDEWIFAASGTDKTRFPWGNTGLVCRRAAFGLVSGPCGSGAEGPELAGMRPGGATASKIHDLSGNVAEWTRDQNGNTFARGGSFRSRSAGELKAWSGEGKPPLSGSPHIGFRCAYSLAQRPSKLSP